MWDGPHKSIPRTTVTFYSGFENARRLRPELWLLQKSWLLHHDNAPSCTSFFTREFLSKEQHYYHTHPPYSPDLPPCDFSVSLIEDKLKAAILMQLR
jgi:hypothetical protein